MGADHGTGLSHSHGGSETGAGWQIVDALVLTAAVIVAGLWAEILYKAWRAQRAERVRSDLTPDAAVLRDVHERDQAEAAAAETS